MQNLLKGPLLIIIAALLWAFDGVLRRSLYHLPPISIIFLEHLIGFLLLYPFVRGSFRTTKITKKECGLMGIIALFSGLLGTLFFTAALQATSFIPFSVVFLLQKLQPIFALLFAWIILKEKPNRAYLPWAILALIAAYFVTFPLGHVNLTTGNGTITAALLALGAAITWGGSTAFSKKVLATLPVLLVTGLRFFFTLVLSGILVIALGKWGTIATVGAKDLLMLLVIALSTGMIALLIYYKGLRNTPVRVATILELTFPLIAVFIDVFVYHTVLHPTQYIAALVLLFAMYQVTKKGNVTH